jgi:hypothetical protein
MEKHTTGIFNPYTEKQNKIPSNVFPKLLEYWQKNKKG